MTSHSFKAPELTDHFILTGHLGVLKSIGTTPHAGYKLLDELVGRIAAIRPLLRQVQSIKTTVEIHLLEHFLEHEYARPGRDLFIGKLDCIVHRLCQKI